MNQLIRNKPITIYLLLKWDRHVRYYIASLLQSRLVTVDWFVIAFVQFVIMLNNSLTIEKVDI